MSVKPTLELTTTTTVQLSASLRRKVQPLIETHQQLQREIKEREERQTKLKEQVEEAFVEADEVDALMEGVKIGDVPIKVVCGKSSRLDKKRLVELGCEPEWLVEATKTTDNRPYLRIGGGKKEED